MKTALLAALLISSTASADTLAACDGLTVTTSDDGRVHVESEIDNLSLRLLAVTTEHDRRALTLGDDDWHNDLTVVFVEGPHPGVVVLGARNVEWFTGASCPVPVLRVPPSPKPQPPCKKRGLADVGACQAHEQHLASRARFGLALGGFVEARESVRSSNNASDSLDHVGSAATTLLIACIDIQESGVASTPLWSEQIAAHCYKKLVAAFDPVKD